MWSTESHFSFSLFLHFWQVLQCVCKFKCYKWVNTCSQIGSKAFGGRGRGKAKLKTKSKSPNHPNFFRLLNEPWHWRWPCFRWRYQCVDATKDFSLETESRLWLRRRICLSSPHHLGLCVAFSNEHVNNVTNLWLFWLDSNAFVLYTSASLFCKIKKETTKLVLYF